MATPRKLRGFSLLEMLVAVVVLSMVIGISTYAYSLFIRQWDGHLGRFDGAQAQYQRLEWLATALQDTLPYVVRDDKGELGFYFLGRDEGLTSVTMSPIFGVGEPALIRVFIRHRLVIARGLPRPEFRYFGWADLQSRVNIEDSLSTGRAWFDEYDGLRRQFHPEKIELGLGNDAAVFEVPVRADALVTTYAEPE